MQIIQIVNNKSNIPDIFNLCMRIVREVFDSPYKLIIEPDIKNPKDSTFFKLKHLLDNPDRFYIDWDVVAIKKFDYELKRGKPYVYGDARTGCGACAIYANNSLDIINFLMEQYEKRPGKCIHRYIRKNPEMFYTFPKDYLLHLRLISLILRNKNRPIIKNDYCQFSKDKNEKYQFDWIKGINIEDRNITTL